MNTIALILAAGRENHMHSGRAKELHHLDGRSLLEITAEAVRPMVDKTIVVLGHHAAELRPELPEGCLSCVQDFSLGYGAAKAVMTALPLMDEGSKVLITAGDMPCVSADSYAKLLAAVDDPRYHAAVLYADVKEPEGYDRVLFDGDGDVKSIAHSEDLLPHEEDILSVNTRVYCLEYAVLKEMLAILKPNFEQRYRISDLIGLLPQAAYRVAAIAAVDPQEGKRIISREDLAQASAYLVQRHCKELMHSGVTLIDPANTYIEGGVEIGQDTIIYPGCYLQRGTRIGARCTILPGCRLENTVVGNDAVLEQLVAEDSFIEDGAHVGPFVHLKGTEA